MGLVRVNTRVMILEPDMAVLVIGKLIDEKVRRELAENVPVHVIYSR